MYVVCINTRIFCCFFEKTDLDQLSNLGQEVKFSDQSRVVFIEVLGGQLELSDAEVGVGHASPWLVVEIILHHVLHHLYIGQTHICPCLLVFI